MVKEKLTANVLFAGIGTQERGIQNTGLYDLEVVSTSEINKDAILAYAAIHYDFKPEDLDTYDQYPSIDEMINELTEKNIGYEPEKNKHYNWQKHKKNSQDVIKKYWLACKLNKNYGDISKIESLPYADLWTVSFPCQSISCAGKMKGFKPDSGTRSSLLWENIRLLKKAVDDGESPKYVMFENVKNLVSKNFMPDFLSLIDVLSDLGFNTYWKVLNAKECGVPQNRERVFAFSIRKDIDINTEISIFPIPFECETRLEDILEEEVDEKYFLKNERAQMLIDKLIMDGILPDPNGQNPIAIDLTENEPKKKEKCTNCITSRQRGISHRKQEGTGVVHMFNGEKGDLNE